MSIPFISGLAQVIEPYDALILDLWGVAHDGRRPYPEAPACLKRLRAEGRRLVFLSNAPRRAERIVPFLAEMGLGLGEHYDWLVSSGDIARDALARRDDPWHAALGRAYFHLGPERDVGLLDGLDYRAAALDEADFILNTGLFHDEREGVEDYQRLFAEALGRGLPMVCVNPDLSVMRGDDEVLCAGSLAAAYAARGGDVRYHGKPHRRAYEHCFARLDGVDRRRILVVGDSLKTDIAGAHGAGLDAVLVTGGIHAGEFGAAPGEAPDPELLAAACAAAGARPMAAMAALRW